MTFLLLFLFTVRLSPWLVKQPTGDKLQILLQKCNHLTRSESEIRTKGIANMFAVIVLANVAYKIKVCVLSFFLDTEPLYGQPLISLPWMDTSPAYFSLLPSVRPICSIIIRICICLLTLVYKFIWIGLLFSYSRKESKEKRGSNVIEKNINENTLGFLFLFVCI